ncbi:hypothetical protein EVA25_02330, partial [bacterium]
MPTRRQFLSAASATLAATPLGRHHPLFAQTQTPLLAPYLADVNGDGVIDDRDRAILEQALFAQRGYDITAADGYEHRADVFGRGLVDRASVDAGLSSLDLYQNSGIRPNRPITVAWHYGWYNDLDRPPGWQTVRYKGGDYFSYDPVVEPEFHRLKNEIGVTVDALSWIPVRQNKDNQSNYRSAFLKASNVDTRHVCLLYESTIALPFTGDRIDFIRSDVQRNFREDFREMALFFKEIRDETPANIFTLDNRPVLFIFGTHTWGQLPVLSGNFWAIDVLLYEAREIFKDIYGAPPYIVGEEMYLSATGEFADDRLRRTQNFDAIHVYHHASNLKRGMVASIQMSASYIENQVRILRRTYDAVAAVKNRFTQNNIHVIPNLSPGFAKPAHPTLLLGRSGYADFMKLLVQVHEQYHLQKTWRQALGTTQLPAPVYIVGSWNEEFEGHCVFPFEFNFSVPNVTQQGWDLAMPIKEVFGWNHYAHRP